MLSIKDKFRHNSILKMNYTNLSLEGAKRKLDELSKTHADPDPRLIKHIESFKEIVIDRDDILVFQSDPKCSKYPIIGAAKADYSIRLQLDQMSYHFQGQPDHHIMREWLPEFLIDHQNTDNSLPSFHRLGAIPYVSGDSINIPNNKVNRYRLVFTPDQRYEVLKQAFKSGYKVVAESSDCGSGKSHMVPDMIPSDFEADHIFYVSNSANNPTIKSIEDNYYYLQGRHNGWFRSKETNKLLVSDKAKDGDELVYPPNCSETKNIHKAYELGLSSEQVNNLICHKCPLFDSCKSDAGKDANNNYYGYLYSRRRLSQRQMDVDGTAGDLKYPKVRLHPAALPSTDNTNYSDVILVLEEAGSILFTKTFKQTRKNLEAFSQKKGENILELLEELESPDITRDGIQKFLTWFFAEGDRLRSDDERLTLVHSDLFANLSKEERQKLDLLARRIDKELENLSQQNQKGIGAFNFIKKLILIIIGSEEGAISISKNDVVIEQLNDHLIEILNKAKMVILLDATPDFKTYSRVFDWTILEVSQMNPPMSNLEIEEIHIEGLRHKRNLVSSSGHLTNNRIEAVLDTIEMLDSNFDKSKLIGALKRGSDGDKYYFPIHNRGTNDLKGEKSIAAIACHKINLSAMKSKYCALHGTIEGFDNWYWDRNDAELIQLIGRQRTHDYPETQFKLYLLSDWRDRQTNTELLAHLYGVKYQRTTGLKYHSTAASETSAKKLLILAAIAYLGVRSKNITKKSIAEVTALPETTIQDNSSDLKRICAEHLNISKAQFKHVWGVFSHHIKKVGNRSEEEEDYRANLDFFTRHVLDACQTMLSGDGSLDKTLFYAYWTFLVLIDDIPQILSSYLKSKVQVQTWFSQFDFDYYPVYYSVTTPSLSQLRDAHWEALCFVQNEPTLYDVFKVKFESLGFDYRKPRHRSEYFLVINFLSRLIRSNNQKCSLESSKNLNQTNSNCQKIEVEKPVSIKEEVNPGYQLSQEYQQYLEELRPLVRMVEPLAADLLAQKGINYKNPQSKDEEQVAFDFFEDGLELILTH